MGLRSVERQHNRRLKLTPPAVRGGLLFVNVWALRRSLAAVR